MSLLEMMIYEKFDLNLLVVFEALLEERSVTAAAKRIGLGQPGVSAALGRLRGLVGDPLFMKLSGEMRPTAKALQIAPGITAALGQIRRTLRTDLAFHAATASRKFRVGVTDYTAFVVMPPLVAYARRTAPNIDLDFIEYEKNAVPEMLNRGEIDVALGVFPRPSDRSVATPLFKERFVGIARSGHPNLIGGGMDLQTYANLDHALITTRRDRTGAIDDALARYGLARRIALTLPYALLLPSVLATSDLVAALPSRLAAHPHLGAGLTCFEIPVEIDPWMVRMIWPSSSREDPATQWLRQAIVECCGSPSPARHQAEPIKSA